MEDEAIRRAVLALPVKRAPAVSSLSARNVTRSRRRGAVITAVVAAVAFASGMGIVDSPGDTVTASQPAAPPRVDGVSAADGTTLLGDGAEPRQENALAVSLVAGLTREADGLLFGEFVRARLTAECGLQDSAEVRFNREGAQGAKHYAIIASTTGCGAYVAHLDWRNAVVVPPTEGSPGFRHLLEPRTWLDEFKAGAPPLPAPPNPDEGR